MELKRGVIHPKIRKNMEKNRSNIFSNKLLAVISSVSSKNIMRSSGGDKATDMMFRNIKKLIHGEVPIKDKKNKMTLKKELMIDLSIQKDKWYR